MGEPPGPGEDRGLHHGDRASGLTQLLKSTAEEEEEEVYAKFRSNRSRNSLVIHDCNITVTGCCDLDLGFEPYTTGHKDEGLGEECTQ